jgi:hypothetical protein
MGSHKLRPVHRAHRVHTVWWRLALVVPGVPD